MEDITNEIDERKKEIIDVKKEIKENQTAILVEGISDRIFDVLKGSLESLRTSLAKMEERLVTMEKHRIDLRDSKVTELQQQGQQTSNESSARIEEDMDCVINNWMTTEADPFRSKRKRDIGDESDSDANNGNARKKQINADGEAISVDIVLPITAGMWYLGGESSPLYVRQCVKDLGAAIMEQIIEKKQHHKCAICWVISGAAGIGKSWSINAFVTELLRNGLEVFFHSGSLGRAWLISKNGRRPALVEEIEVIKDPNVVYVYDSPGSKGKLGPKSQARVRNIVGATLIFSSPKRENYAYAEKTDGLFFVKNLPTWSNPEMRVAKNSETAAVDGCYSVWGGNMRALTRYLSLAQMRTTDEARKDAVKQLDAQISCIDKKMADKMSKQLEKQHVNEAFSAEHLKNAPGHILTPEPVQTEPSNETYFEDFFWRFCSPMAEKKFLVHAKSMGKDVVMKLLESVFEVPSPKGVLFEKVAHLLIINGLVRKFRCCSYENRTSESSISFPECEVVNFETDKLEGSMMEALRRLNGQPVGTAIALEPTSASFDAVDMFALVKEDEKGNPLDWRLYLLQDTIARKHSLHPVKVLWYCTLFLDVFKKVLPDTARLGNVLNCCKYIPVVPHESKSFEFEKSESNLKRWEDIDRVAQLLGVTWPKEINQGREKLKKVTKNLAIPPTASGGKRMLTKIVVGNAILNDLATKKVKEMSLVIFDVLYT